MPRADEPVGAHGRVRTRWRRRPPPRCLWRARPTRLGRRRCARGRGAGCIAPRRGRAAGRAVRKREA
eukprot:7245225-Lingulodinium_polyedra.AAC.1